MRYHNITKDDMLNGDGLRVVLWTAGCEHECQGCQNPVTWDKQGGLEFDDAAKQELFNELDKPHISGITLSGGDPLLKCTRSEMTALLREIAYKYPDKTIWMYTGYKWDDVKELELMKYVDVLIDGRFVLELNDNLLKWRGSSNQRVIDVKRSILLEQVVLHCD